MVVAGSSTTDAALAAFDDHLRRVRGVCSEVRRSYGRVAGEFLEMVFGDGPVDLARLSASMLCVRSAPCTSSTGRDGQAA